jgi:hypothetical protein
MPSIEADKWMTVIGNFDDELLTNMGSMSDAELKKRVLQSEVNLIENAREKVKDQKLKKAKKAYDDAKKPYDDAKKFQNAIVQYGMLLLEERGKVENE